MRLIPAFLALLLSPVVLSAQERSFDLVIEHGRVIDPESKLDAVRTIGITNGRIAALTTGRLAGKTVIDAKGLVVAPGFIDLHAHGQDDENYRAMAMDGVTSALELEVGTADVPGWYAERAGKALINYGVSIGHIRVRMAVFNDPGAFLPTADGAKKPASPAEIAEMQRRIGQGLEQGALGVGFGVNYTPATTRWELVQMFQVAANHKAPVFVHVRGSAPTEPGGSVESFIEAIGAAAITGAPLHIVHLNSMSLSQTPLTLELVQRARRRGLDVTTEAYPYSAGMTAIESALMDAYENAPDSIYPKLQWVETGERMTRETFKQFRKQGGMVILHTNTPDMEAMAIESPLTAVASDGLLQHGKGHPRSAGTYARVLGYYVREKKAITLMDAIRKSALLPAQRLEKWAPMFRKKGRIKVGADADLVAFDPATVRDNATYEHPAAYSNGFKYVLVRGIPVVAGGELRVGSFPGRPARSAIR